MKTALSFFNAILILSALINTQLKAQPQAPDTMWTRTYGGSGDDRGNSVKQTLDGGFVIVGSTSSGAGGSDIYLIKTDDDGNQQWSQNFGGNSWDDGCSVQQTGEGGYIMVGKTRSYSSGDEDVYLVKADAEGIQQWYRTFGGSNADGGHSVQQTGDGGYIIVGFTGSYGAGGYDVYLIKTDEGGNQQWYKTFGGSNNDGGYSVQQTSDGGYIIAGWTWSYGVVSDVYIIKTDSLGNQQWYRTFGGSNLDGGNSVQQTSDGGYIIAGITSSYGAGSTDLYLIKTDASGNQQWFNTFGAEFEDGGNEVQQIDDGGYIIAGWTSSYGSGESDVYLIKTDNSGNQQWYKTIGGIYSDFGLSVQQTIDKGFIIAGQTNSYGAGNIDVYLIKTYPEPENTLSGPLSGTLGPGTYIVTEDIYINEGDALIIQPGTILKFDYTATLVVNGYLYAVGTETDSIKFILNNDTLNSDGIDFNDTASDSSRLEYCLITGSRSAGINCISASPTISHCTICNNSSNDGGGIHLSTMSSPNINYCDIINNIALATCGGGIECYMNSNPIIYHCTIYGNSANSGEGGGIHCYSSSPLINNCNFEDNHAIYGGGIACFNNSNPSLNENIIENNSVSNAGGGIICDDNSDPIINFCIISNNSAIGGGGAIYIEENCTPNINHCNFYGNSSSNYAGGIFCNTDGSVIMENSVLTNCTNGAAIVFNNSVGNSISYSDFYNNLSGNFSGNTIPAGLYNIISNNANSDSCDIYQNIFLDPLFYSTTGDSAFYLTGASPCIDAGDPTSPLDPDSTIADIGAYFYPHENTLSGPLSGSLGPGTYIVTGTISVLSGNSLIIQPGSTFKFNDGTEFNIYGYLRAEGTETDSIKFIKNEGASGWGGISFWDSAIDSSIMSYCLVSGSTDRGLYIDSTSPHIKHCLITGNSAQQGAGLYIWGSNSIVEYCTIKNNIGDTPANDGGGGIYINYGNTIIRNCDIIDNFSDYGSGIYLSYSNASIINCLFYGNTTNDYGGGIWNKYGTPTIEHCDFYNNNANIIGYGLNPNLGVISTTNGNGDPCDVFHNIFLNPLFVDTSAGNYNLQPTSPCIDAGDPSSPGDPDGTIADIGAFYYDQGEPPLYLNSVKIRGLISSSLDPDLTDYDNLAALDSNATDLYDAGIDVPEPLAPPSNYLSLYFPHSGWGAPVGNNFMYDVRNANDDLINALKEYDFQVATDQSGETVELEFEIGSAYPTNYGLVLCDSAGGDLYNLREINSIVYTAGASPHNFTLKVGDGTPPVITAEFPLPDTTLLVDSTFNLYSTLTDISFTRHGEVYYSLNNGTDWFFIAYLYEGQNSTLWTVPDTTCYTVRLKIEAEDWPGNSDSLISEQFNILYPIPPAVTITIPTADTLLYCGITYIFNWTISNNIYDIISQNLYYSLDDGSSWITSGLNVPGDLRTYWWQAPPGIYTCWAKFKVEAFDAVGQMGSGISDAFNIAPNFCAQGFGPVWNLLSIPLHPENNSVASVFGDDITGVYFVYGYNQGGGGYSLVNSVNLGQGYWLVMDSSATLDVWGEPEVDSLYLPLTEGWNIIGDAIPSDVPRDSLCILENGVIYSFSAAVDSDWIEYDMFRYNPTAGNYSLDTLLVPWGGYWMWANVPDLELITYPPYPDTTGQDYFTCPQKTNPANWFAHIYLERGNLTDDLSGFGMNIEALDAYDHWYDAIAPPLPPDGNYIRAVFYHPEWGRPAGSAFCRDVRKAFNEASNIPMFKEWIFSLESSDTGQIDLNFPEIEKILPEGYSATLFFPDLFLNLLEQHSFSLAYSEPLEIRLRVYNRPATLLGWNLSGIEIQIPDNYGIENIYPNPFNSQALLRVALPQTSLLEVKVYDILGRQTAVLFDGVCPAGYKSVVFEGRNLASGLYFIKMEVPGKFVQMKKVVLIK